LSTAERTLAPAGCRRASQSRFGWPRDPRLTWSLDSVSFRSGDEADFAKGTTHLVRWGMVEQWVAQGRVELI
jgi:hypothetical protein